MKFLAVFVPSFENMPWNLLDLLIWKKREVVSSFLMQEKTYWQLFMVGTSLAADSGEKRSSKI